MRQIIIVRKDLNMNSGKLAAQVAHASLAFISNAIRNCVECSSLSQNYLISLKIPKDVYEQWFCGIFTKTVCEAKNHRQIMKAISIAEEIGLKEGTDFFLIKDACLTDLEPEEIDENGQGRTLTCIGFRPLDDETAWKISKKFQLYH
jgi:PTH2 family peptidyl-tRNA hydrolase